METEDYTWKGQHNYWKYTKKAWNDTLKVKYNEITAENGEVKKS